MAIYLIYVPRIGMASDFAGAAGIGNRTRCYGWNRYAKRKRALLQWLRYGQQLRARSRADSEKGSKRKK